MTLKKKRILNLSHPQFLTYNTVLFDYKFIKLILTKVRSINSTSFLSIKLQLSKKFHDLCTILSVMRLQDFNKYCYLILLSLVDDSYINKHEGKDCGFI